MNQAAARVEAVNVLHALRPGRWADTAIDKRPVRGRVAVGPLGLDGDRQVLSSHGGRDKAVYVYAREDAAWWEDRLGREVPAGLLGENLSTVALRVTDAVVGERWQVGEVLLEVRLPRTPCENLSMRIGIEGFHIELNRSGRVGAMCRVLEPGTVAAGDPVTVVARPDHGVRVADLAVGPDAAQLRALLDSGVPLASTLRARARRVVARQSGTQQ